MAEAVAATVAWLTEGEVILTAFEAFAGAAAIELVAAQAYNNYAKRRAREKAKEAHNASLRDRYVMTRNAIAPRRIVLGRQRVSGSISFVKSYGVAKEKLVVVLPLSAEEIDGVDEIYFDDEPVVLDVSGNVLGVKRREYFALSGTGDTFTLQGPAQGGTVSAVVKYGTDVVTLGNSGSGASVTVSGGTAGRTGTVTVTYQPDPSPFVRANYLDAQFTVTVDGSGNGSATLAAAPRAGTLFVGYSTGGDNPTTDLSAYASVTGGTALTITGSPVVSQTLYGFYQYADAQPSRAQVRVHTGAPGQVADAGLIAALPGVWTSAHVGNSIAYIAAEFDYDPDAFPSSIPQMSALVRGSKLYDPRTGLTVFSENPALMSRHVALHPLFGRLQEVHNNTDAVIVAANICDTPVDYVVGGRTYTRPRYRAGLVAVNGTRADDIIQDLCEAMGGDRAFVDGQLRVKAGAWSTPLQTLDESWLMKEGGSVQVQRRRPTSEVSNIISGVFADEERDYQILDFPTVRSATYIAEDGEELPEDLELNAVTFSAQAQQIAAQRMRRKRFGRRISVTCNYRAYFTEWGDVLNVNLPSRFGYLNLPCEVIDVSFTLDNGIQLTMEEITPAIWEIGASFAEVPLRPNTFMLSPGELPEVTGLAVSSASAVQVRNGDGTVLQQMRVSWSAIANQAVLGSGGGVEVRYGVASWPESQWLSARAESPATSVDIVGVQQGQIYLVKARTFNKLTTGKWSAPEIHGVDVRAIVVDTPQLAANAATETISVPVDTNVYAGAFSTPAPGEVSITRSFPSRALITITGDLSCVNSSGSSKNAYARCYAEVNDGVTSITGYGGLRRVVANGETFAQSVISTLEVDMVAGSTYQIFMNYSDHVSATQGSELTNIKTKVELIKR